MAAATVLQIEVWTSLWARVKKGNIEVMVSAG